MWFVVTYRDYELEYVLLSTPLLVNLIGRS